MSVSTNVAVGAVTAAELRGYAWDEFTKAYNLDVANGVIRERSIGRHAVPAPDDGGDATYYEFRLPSEFSPSGFLIAADTGTTDWRVQFDVPDDDLDPKTMRAFIAEIADATIFAEQLHATGVMA